MGRYIAFLVLFFTPTPIVMADGTADYARGMFRLCQSCHGPQGEGNPRVLAPAIAGLPAWYVQNQLEKFRTGVRGKHAGDAAGLKMYPMAKMLKAEDVAPIATYVASLPRAHPEPTVHGDKDKGKERYAPCAACHGANAEGNQALNAPPLRHLSDWYVVKQIHAFQQGLRGADPTKDMTGATMVPMSRVLENDQAIADVLEYVRSLPE